MKNKLFTILAFVSISLAARAQVSTNAMPPMDSSGFIHSVGGYFSSFNPDLPFTGVGEIAIGMAYQSGVNIASDLDLRFDVYNIGTNGLGIFAESVTRNAGVAGVIVSEQAGGGILYRHIDTELSAGVLGGYRFDTGGPAVTIYADVRKMMTENTYSGLRLAAEIDGRAQNNSPVITAYTGFKF